jgi:hypothetical protein
MATNPLGSQIAYFDLFVSLASCWFVGANHQVDLQDLGCWGS